MGKIIITAALTGSIHTPSMSEYLPFRTKDMIEEGIRSYNAGAAVVHVHREKSGERSPLIQR